MKVQILEVLPTKDDRDGCDVVFLARAGQAHGRWIGERPVEFDVANVELAVSDALAWGRNVRLLDASTFLGIHERDGHVILVGQVSSWDALTGAFGLALGTSIVLLSVGGDAPEMEAGAVVGVAATALALHDGGH